MAKAKRGTPTSAPATSPTARPAARSRKTMQLRQLANTVRALHDARRAAGDAQLADEIRRVVLKRLQRVHDARHSPRGRRRARLAR